MSVKGLKYQLSTEQLKIHLMGRVEHHKKKAEWYKDKLGTLRQGLDREESRMSSMNSNPIEEFEKKIKKHENLVSSLTFMADHLIPSENYILDDDDLRKIEVVESGYY